MQASRFSTIYWVSVSVKEKLKEYLADFLLIVVAVTWGVTFLPVQKTVDETPVYVFLFYRFLLASALMGLLSVRHFRHISKTSVKGGIVLGMVLFLGFAFQTYGLKYTFSSTVAFITGLSVVMVPLFAYLFFRQLPSLYSNIGAVIAAIGLYFLTSSELGFGWGEFLCLICAVMFAGQIVLTSFYVHQCNVFILVFFQFLTVCILSFFSALICDSEQVVVTFSPVFMFTVLITAVFATVFAFFVQTFMQKFTTPAKTAIIFTLEPVTAGLAGYFLGNEVLGLTQIMGAGLIISGVLFAEIGTYLGNKNLA